MLILRLKNKPLSVSMSRESTVELYIASQTEEQAAERIDKYKEYLSSLSKQETAEIHIVY